MANYPFSIISVFTSDEYSCKGNTAAIVVLDAPFPNHQMQNIAADYNQPATTFLWQDEHDQWHVRWFAPDDEIELCGHGSLAAFAYLQNQKPLSIKYKSGFIEGHISGQNQCAMILDPIESNVDDFDPAIAKGLGVDIKGYYENNNKHIVLVESEEVVKKMQPNFAGLRGCEPFGYVVTAKGSNTDFVSRTIVPKVQQLEDHATGSSHAALTPFWSDKLGKDKLTGLQLSPRGGFFNCEMINTKVKLSGQYKTLVSGKAEI
ncbi:PhzF family phenazine biosynthesis protein [Fulvivirga sp. RKSG066]|uniref:PhzF family phenazine biosynthesis protein n=1 Tax=Fulvivirga aurantia TaxID=2529383 RepID=UPI0012BB8683|nr:PhzF family phenazine biosynthesis protein [Fulvivirga aurantia]MTI21198.1 PhzF family phenazine biosynthesis protein [Fulvivirga aurantia]